MRMGTCKKKSDPNCMGIRSLTLEMGMQESPKASNVLGELEGGVPVCSMGNCDM